VASDEQILAPLEPDGDSRMPLIEHLTELRVRLIRSVIAIGVGFLIAYAIDDWLFNMLTYPLRIASHNRVLLIGTGVGEAFFTKLKVALIAGLFIASPAVFLEIWKFIAPGLYESERRLAKPFVLCATLFFLAGGYFCWAVVFKIGYSSSLANTRVSVSHRRFASANILHFRRSCCSPSASPSRCRFSPSS